jgi:two-component system alkaline phosphatase synthesis response regulator PhoP
MERMKGEKVSTKRVLLVEDEPGLVVFLSDRLKSEGYAVTAAMTGEEGIEAARTQHFDVIILDIMLPDRSGLDVCRDIRQDGIKTPVIMLTARDQLTDKVIGLKIGADDYLTKPFEALELLARIEALLRRAPQPDTERTGIYHFDDVQVDFQRVQVFKAGTPVDLNAMHLKLLRYFIQNRGRVLSRNELLDKVWEFPASVYSRTVDVHVSELRRMLEDDAHHPRYFTTVHGFGYKFSG